MTTTLDPEELTALSELQSLIGRGNADRGFHERGDRLRFAAENQTRFEGQAPLVVDEALRDYYVSRLALITTEVAEAIEELRAGRAVDETWYTIQGEPVTRGTGDFSHLWEGWSGDASWSIDHVRKPEGVPSEVADVVIRAFDFAHEAGFDLAAIIEEKLAYNATRGHKHGKVF